MIIQLSISYIGLNVSLLTFNNLFSILVLYILHLYNVNLANNIIL